MKRRFLFHVLTPLILGGAIYICWRDPSLRMFEWFRLAGLGSIVSGIRQVALPYAVLFPNWVLYSLPDALWVYAAIMFMDCIWVRGERRSISRLFWLSSGPLLAIAIELAQLARFAPGDFDPTDLILSAVASVAAFVIITFRNPLNRIEKGTQHVQANKNELALGGRT
jgi:hypothetical protein